LFFTYLNDPLPNLLRQLAEEGAENKASRYTTIFRCAAALCYPPNLLATNILLLCSFSKRQRRENICRKNGKFQKQAL